MNVDLNVKTLLDDVIDYDDILLWCYNNDIIGEDLLRQKLNLKEDDSLPKLSDNVSVNLLDHGIWEDDLLDMMYERDIIDYLENEGHVIDPTEETVDNVDLMLADKYEWIRNLKCFFNRQITKVFNKEDFKKEINQLIDDGLYY